MMIYDCIIVGAGAAGLFCSAVFSGKVNGLILEKTRRAGTKLLMSGGGQCNITHSGSIKDFVPRYGKNGGKIRSCLFKYNNLHLQDFLRDNGIQTVTREDGKVFPRSMDAKEIQEMLLNKAEKNGFSIKYQADVTAIRRLPGDIYELTAETFTSDGAQRAQQYQCKNLIIACGGCSYPTTGSDGSIFEVLHRDLKLSVTPLRPALTPVNTESYPYSSLSGISFEQAGLQVWRSENGKDFKKTASASGPLLFTHRNFSGPLILNLSNSITKNDKIVLNYLYPCDKKEALDKINKAIKNSKQNLVNALSKEFQLPKSFMTEILKETGEKPKAIAARLTEDTFTVKSTGGYEKAMVTSGGIQLSQINPKTMECKTLPGLYIIGETLDIDGETGGYNLQFAYSSACAAAQTAFTIKGGRNAKTQKTTS